MPGFTAVNEEPADTDVHVEASHGPVWGRRVGPFCARTAQRLRRAVSNCLLPDGLPAVAARPSSLSRQH